MGLQVVIEHRNAYGKTLCPKNPLFIGNDVLHTATADVHNQFGAFAERHGKTHAKRNQAGLFISVNQLDLYARLLPDTADEIGTVGSRSQGCCTYGPHLLHRPLALQDFRELAQGI